MTAVRDGDEWVINGQKVWTSGAQYSDFGEIICRTNPDAEKHKGITAFIVDMRAPGVTIKPLKQMNGGASFNEVFFDDVRVPHDHVLGDVNEGWTVAITTLMNERVAIGSGGGGGARGSVHDLIDLARRRGVNTDPVIRQQLADLYTKTRISKFLSMRTLTAARKGKVPGPEGSIGKLFGGRIMTQIGELTIDLVGVGRRRRGDDDYRWHQTLARCTGRSHRRRLRRGDEEHHRRARARPSRRAAPRQGRRLARSSPLKRVTGLRLSRRGRPTPRRRRRPRPSPAVAGRARRRCRAFA